MENLSDIPAIGVAGDVTESSAPAGDAAPDTQPETAPEVVETQAETTQEQTPETTEGESAADASQPESKTRTDWRGEYFKAKQTFEPKITELETKLAEATTDFIGIKADQPPDVWNPQEQINALPDAYHDKLVETVIQDSLPAFVQIALSDPAAYPTEFGMLYNTAVQFVEAAYRRPVAEVDQLLNLTQGLTIDQLQAALSGGSPSAFPQAPLPGSYALPQSGAPSLVQQLLADGHKPEDPVVRAAYAMEQQSAALLKQVSDLNSRFGEVSTWKEQQEQAKAQAAQQAATQQLDTQTATVRATALDQALKGRIPDAKIPVLKPYIQDRLERLIAADPTAQNALNQARQYLHNGIENRAKTQLASYAAIATRLAQQAASGILNEFVSGTEAKRQIDEQKAGRKELANAGTGASLTGVDNGLEGIDFSNPSNFGEAARTIYRKTTGTP